ncbi:SMI1/KNR4 family protein [Enterobacter asburiae]|uniref:SMI1/KNR4 family protein n=1 Tax=Enterobacter asburiae TaxID=61645 RepID=UPI002666E27F|nr:SMI1/KNR4 family protein [Enterobacter asburiae]MDO2453616.1 SMI1/KNR4 family protein [Enterobacter asburiae]
MMTIKTAIEYLDNNATEEVFWLGQVDTEQIDSLENNLGIKLPSDFREFLLLVGGGGGIGEEISGIVDNNALEESGGAVYYDTIYCRNEFSLPENYAVIYFKDDEVCWCIDSGSESFGRVVNYDLFSKSTTNTISSSFSEFFDNYVKLRT